MLNHRVLKVLYDLKLSKEEYLNKTFVISLVCCKSDIYSKNYVSDFFRDFGRVV